MFNEKVLLKLVVCKKLSKKYFFCFIKVVLLMETKSTCA